MINQMLQRDAGDRDIQPIHACEIRLALFAWGLRLRKEDLFIRTMKCPPVSKPALQCSQLSPKESVRVFTLEFLEYRFRLQPFIMFQ